jgi:3-deoxy-D-arabino-heptulosonate 7-phosphate (DAHP) synthase
MVMPAQEFEAGLLLAAAECTGPCKCRLAVLLTRDLQQVLEECRQQLHEVLSSTTEQLFVVSCQGPCSQNAAGAIKHFA